MTRTSTVLARLGLLAGLAALPAWAFGQQNFQPAKVTTLTGDTLRGFIDYKGWDKNPKLVVFKPDLQAPAQTFRPLDIKGFLVNSEQYTGSAVAIETSPTILEELTVSPVPLFRTDTTFLRTVVSGPRSLYRNKVDGREFFYTEQQGKFDLLIYKRYKPSSTYTVVRFNNTYREQLAKYLADCPTIEAKSKQLLYTSSTIQKLFKTYYTCTGQQGGFRQNKTTYQFGVLAGVTRSTVRFDASPSFGPPPGFDNNSTYGPTGGLFFYIPLPGNLGHFSINNDVVYTSFKSSGSTMTGSYSGNYNAIASSISLAYLKLNTQLRFTRPIGSGSLFINAGMSNSYAIEAKNERTVTTQFYSTVKTTTSEIFPMERYESGLVAGLGGSIKRLSAEARYERTGGFLNLVFISSRFERLSLLVGYRLF